MVVCLFVGRVGGRAVFDFVLGLAWCFLLSVVVFLSLFVGFVFWCLCGFCLFCMGGFFIFLCFLLWGFCFWICFGWLPLLRLYCFCVVCGSFGGGCFCVFCFFAFCAFCFGLFSSCVCVSVFFCLLFVFLFSFLVLCFVWRGSSGVCLFVLQLFVCWLLFFFVGSLAVCWVFCCVCRSVFRWGGLWRGGLFWCSFCRLFCYFGCSVQLLLWIGLILRLASIWFLL